MTTLRNTLFKILCNKTVSQLISINQRHPSEKCTDNKAMHFSVGNFFLINQLVKKYRNAPDKILQGVPIIIMRPEDLIIRLLCIQQ
jgi:hypothetical protein